MKKLSVMVIALMMLTPGLLLADNSARIAELQKEQSAIQAKFKQLQDGEAQLKDKFAMNVGAAQELKRQDDAELAKTEAVAKEVIPQEAFGEVTETALSSKMVKADTK